MPGLILNPRVESGVYPRELGSILSHAAFESARAEITSWPGYALTPLVSLPALAREVGVSSIAYKDEWTRFGLGAFKALGGAYAVYRVLADIVAQETGSRAVSSRELRDGTHRDITSGITVTCASAGNHGRSVAWGAELFGCRSVVYLHDDVPAEREALIAGHGAETVRVSGTYDDAVRRADDDAKRNGWTVVSDTSYPGYVEIPRFVMQGYAIMVDEAVRQLGDERPTHVFVQAGVGGLAAAVCAHLWEMWGAERPSFVVVEPEKAACLYRSASVGRLATFGGPLDSIMGGLAAGVPSLLAWQVLERCVDAFMTISDEDAHAVSERLARATSGDVAIEASESGVAGLAGALAAAADETMRAGVGLSENSRVLVFGSEGRPA